MAAQHYVCKKCEASLRVDKAVRSPKNFDAFFERVASEWRHRECGGGIQIKYV